MFTQRPYKDFAAQNAEQFETICRLAEAGDAAGLEKLRAAGVYINMWNGIHTPTSFLAAKGNEKAFIFLTAHGAYFNDVLRGLAIGKQEALLDKYLHPFTATQGLILAVLEGYAIAGDKEKINYWFRLANDSALAVGAITHGYAMGKQAILLADVIQKSGGYFKDAISGLAYVGNEEEVDRLISQSVEIKKYAMQCALINYAFGGHHQQVVNLLAKEGAKPTYAAIGYIRLGDADHLQKMILRGGVDLEAVVSSTHHNLEFPTHKYAIPCALRLLASMSNPIARKQLAETMQGCVSKMINFKLEDAATEIRNRMDEKRLEFDVAWEEYKGTMPLYRQHQ